MIFKYKVKKMHDIGEYIAYHIKIYRYHPDVPIFKWDKILDGNIIYILCRLNPKFKEDNDILYNWEVSNKMLNNELQRYSSMDDLIRQYILYDCKCNKEYVDYDEANKKFILTNGWRTIEVKENE